MASAAGAASPVGSLCFRRCLFAFFCRLPPEATSLNSGAGARARVTVGKVASGAAEADVTDAPIKELIEAGDGSAEEMAHAFCRPCVRCEARAHGATLTSSARSACLLSLPFSFSTSFSSARTLRLKSSPAPSSPPSAAGDEPAAMLGKRTGAAACLDRNDGNFHEPDSSSYVARSHTYTGSTVSMRARGTHAAKLRTRPMSRDVRNRLAT